MRHRPRHFDRCGCESRRDLWGAFLLGISILTLGVILVLHNFGVIDGNVLAPYWPVLVMIVGLRHLVRPADWRRVAWGLWWIAVGAIILLNNLGVIAVGIWDLWPMILVIIGAHLTLTGRGDRPRSLDDGPRSESTPTV